MAARFAILPFASRADDDRSARIAQGLSLELADWLRGTGAGQVEVPLLTSAQTEEDGAWRKLVNFQDELAPSAVCEILELLRDDDSGEVESIRLVAGGLIDVAFDGDRVTSVTGEVTITDVAASFNAGRIAVKLDAASFRAGVPALMAAIAAALEHTPPAAYDTLTGNFQAWLNLLITRALKLAAELGAIDRSEDDLYSPAVEAAKLDPAFTPARERLGELAQVLVFERGFEPLPAAHALAAVVKRTGPDWKSERVRGQLMMIADNPDQAARSFCHLIKGKLEAPTAEERSYAALMAGRAFNQANRYAEAQRVLSLAMQSEPIKVDAIVEAGSSSAGLGEALVAEKAAHQYEAMLSAPELPREVYADAAEFFVYNQMHETACAAAERYAQEFPGDAIAHVLLASSLNSLGRHKRALAALERAELCAGVSDVDHLVARQRRYAQHPEVEAEFRRLAEIAMDGDAADAERALAAMVERFPDFWEAHYFLGVSLRRQEKWQAARDKLEAVNTEIELPGIDKQLTQIYSALGQPQQALEHARRAIDYAPDDPTAMTNYAAALLENDRLDEALKYAQRASAIMPEDAATGRLLALLEARFKKRGLLANFRSVWKETASWLKMLKRKREA